MKFLLTLLLSSCLSGAVTAQEPAFPLPAHWTCSAPLLAPEAREAEPSRAQKDPTVVFHEGKWHVFMTVKLPGRSAIEYCSFTDWSKSNAAKRILLPLSESNYFCAPQVFYTSLNGKMWRLWTKLSDFPKGFSHCELALQAQVFEASHTYRVKGKEQYLTIIEENGKRYYKAYLADRLDGEWKPLADTARKPFAGWNNVRPAAGVEPWTDNISHGELIREGVDETLTIDPDHLRFVFQGMLETHKQGKGYGAFQWRIGMLTPE